MTETTFLSPFDVPTPEGAEGWEEAGIRQTTGARALTLRKPSPVALREMCRALGAKPARTLVVGDDLTLEVAMARRAGARAALVLTGTGTAEAAAAAAPTVRPHAVLASVREILES